jgi:hypothetical protein
VTTTEAERNNRFVFVCDDTTGWDWHSNRYHMTHSQAVEVASKYQQRCDYLGKDYAVAIVNSYGSAVYVTAATDSQQAQDALTRIPKKGSNEDDRKTTISTREDAKRH